MTWLVIHSIPLGPLNTEGRVGIQGSSPIGSKEQESIQRKEVDISGQRTLELISSLLAASTSIMSLYNVSTKFYQPIYYN